MDLHAMIPVLKNNGVIHLSEDHELLLANTRISTEKRIDLVISWMPRCGKSDYLTPFIQCLRKTADSGAGEGHDELISKLEERKHIEAENDAVGECVINN